jgi:hypothetical protein
VAAFLLFVKKNIRDKEVTVTAAEKTQAIKTLSNASSAIKYCAFDKAVVQFIFCLFCKYDGTFESTTTAEFADVSKRNNCVEKN